MKEQAPDDQVRPFPSVRAQDIDADFLNNELDERGYVLLRDLLPAENLSPLLGEILQITSEAGWLSPEHHQSERIVHADAACGESEPAFEAVYQQIFRLERFHALAHHPKLREVMESIVGPQLLVHPKPIGRLMFPRSERFMIHAHQDHGAVGGDPHCYTAWMPLHDCPAALGPLQVLEGSHRFGVQEADPATGFIPRESTRGKYWVGGAMRAGDVLIFHGLTVHSGSPNRSHRLRISMDCRFQNYAHAFNPANMVFPGTSGRSWKSTYAHWSSDRLQYFWKQLPLVFKPSVEELKKLAETDESPRMRLRYAAILKQLHERADTTNPPSSSYDLSDSLSSMGGACQL